MNILIINGPNLNLLGKREITIYGSSTYADLEQHIRETASKIGFKATIRQTNHEGFIIDWLHEANEHYDAIILNAGAFTHYSYAIMDAVKAIETPVIEVHLTDITKREDAFRKTSVLEPVCLKRFMGKGFQSYTDALKYLDKDVIT